MALTKVTTNLISDDAITGSLIADDLVLGGNPTTTTQSAGNNTTRLATTAFVTTAVANLADSAPSTLNTLNELAAALGDDENFSTTVTDSIALKAPLASPTFTGTVNAAAITATGNVKAGNTSTGINLTIDSTDIFRIDGVDTGGNGFNSIHLRADGTAGLFVQKDTNRVGIGTTSPTHQLHLKGPSSAYAAMRIESTSTGHGAIINLSDSTDDDYGQIVQFASSAGEGGRMRFIAGGTETLNLRGGKVGIGNSTPTSNHAKANNLVVGSGSAGGMAVYNGLNEGWYAFSRSNANNTDAYDGGISYNGDRDLKFHTNAGTTRMTIDSGGKVGIGVDPSYKLDISGTGDTVQYIANANPSHSTGRTLLLRDNYASSSQNSKISYAATSSPGQDVYFGKRTTSNAGFFHLTNSSGTEHLTVNMASGDVGINNTTPDNERLSVGGYEGIAINSNYCHVGSTSSGAMAIFGHNIKSHSANNTLKSANTGYHSSMIKMYYNEGITFHASSSTATAGDTFYDISGTTNEHMRITNDGKVGIGTISPDANLTVKSSDGSPFITIDKSTTGVGGILLKNAGSNKVKLLSNASEEFELHVNNSLKLYVKEDGKVCIGANDPSGTLDIRGGRAGIISTDSSWGQFRVANSSVAEVGVTVMNGCTASEYLSDGAPTSSNKFIMGIHPYGAGTDTWGIGHGNLGDSVMHIDGSGNFGFGPNTDNPLTYFEISKTRPNVNAPSDYELKLTLNTYGYVGSNYKLGMIQFVGGDTASAQDNFYAGLSARAVNGANHQEDGALQFHVRSDQDTNTLAVELNGEHNTGSQIAGGGSTRNGMLFRWQGIAIDRSWGNYPGIAVMNSSDYSTSQSAHSEFRVHGTNGASSSYPSSSGSDFSVNFRVDGSYLSGSDKRRKTNITEISGALGKVKQLTGKRFQTVNRSGDVNKYLSKADNYKFGFIAQDVEDIIPEAVKYHADEDDGTEDWNSAYSIDYASLTALLVNAIKEQDTTIQDLKSRIETLEG